MGAGSRRQNVVWMGDRRRSGTPGSIAKRVPTVARTTTTTTTWATLQLLYTDGGFPEASYTSGSDTQPLSRQHRSPGYNVLSLSPAAFLKHGGAVSQQALVPLQGFPKQSCPFASSYHGLVSDVFQGPAAALLLGWLGRFCLCISHLEVFGLVDELILTINTLLALQLTSQHRSPLGAPVVRFWKQYGYAGGQNESFPFTAGLQDWLPFCTGKTRGQRQDRHIV